MTTILNGNTASCNTHPTNNQTNNQAYAAFLAASSRSYKNAIIQQTEDFGFPGDISRRIERRATELTEAKDIPALRLLSNLIDKFKPQVDALYAFGIKPSYSSREISITTKRLAGLSAESHQNGTIIQDVGISNQARELLHLDDSLQSRFKAADPVYWSRRIKKQWRSLESELNFILQHKEVKTGVQWISPEAARRYQSAHEFSKTYAAGIQLIDKSTGEAKAAQKIFDPDEADRRLYANYLARAKGIATLAGELGLGLAAMITITLPSKHHPLKTCEKTGKRIPNPKFEGWTIRESDRKFRNDFIKIRALLAKHKIGIDHYFLAAQCHKSGVPHYHLTGFFRDEAHLRAVLQRMTQTTGQPWMLDHKNGSFESAQGITHEDPEIKGIRADIFRKKSGEPHPEGALAYMLASLKYLLPTEAEGEKQNSKRSNEEVRAIKAWAQANNIRRFSTSHGHSTLWTLLRKLEDIGSAAQCGAKDGDYARFYKALHLINEDGRVKKAGSEHFDFLKISKENDYAERIEVIRGVNFSRVSPDGTFSFTKQHRLSKEWEITRVISQSSQGVTLIDKNLDGSASPHHNPPIPIDFGQYLAPI